MGIWRFESLTQYVGEWEKLPYATKRHHQGDGKDWALGLSWEQTLERAKKGDPAVTENVRAGLDKLDLSNMTDAYGVAWRPNVVGQRVSVGDYLAGNPMCMRRRMKVEANVRHVHIYVELAALMVVKADEMLARGKAVLGLLEALQAMRVSVDLTLVVDTNGDEHEEKDGCPRGTLLQLIPVECRPLNISESGFAIAHPAFVRIMTYAMADTRGFYGGRSSAMRQFTSETDPYKPQSSNSYISWLRKTLKMEPHDIYIPEMHRNDKIAVNPGAWIQDRINQVANG